MYMYVCIYVMYMFNNVISYWNNLPSNVVEAGSLELFKCKLKSFLKL